MCRYLVHLNLLHYSLGAMLSRPLLLALRVVPSALPVERSRLRPASYDSATLRHREHIFA